MRKKIAFLMHYRRGGGGVNTLADYYIKELAKNFDIDLYLQGIEDPNDMVPVPNVVKKNVKSITYFNAVTIRNLVLHNMGRGRVIKKELREMDNFIQKFNEVKYDTVISFICFQEWLLSIVKNCPNKISFVHTEYKTQRELRDVNFITMAKYVDKWVCVSDESANQLIEYLPHRKDDIEVVVNTADLETIDKLSKKPIFSFKERAIFKSGLPVIGVIGRIEERQKNTIRMVRISKSLNDAGINHKMVFIGPVDPQTESEIQKWTEYVEKYNVNDSIHWIGPKKNVYKYLKKLDLFALCSNYEGLSIALIEALCLNVKTLVTDTVSLEFAKGKNLCAVCKNKEEKILDKLKEIVENDFSEFKKFENSREILKATQEKSIKKLNDFVEGNYETK